MEWEHEADLKRDSPPPEWLDHAARLCGDVIVESLLDGPDNLWTPAPSIATAVLDRAGYPDSFPHLLAHVVPHLAEPTTQEGAERVSLSPAACYHMYPDLEAGRWRANSHRDVLAWCYRHEETTGAFRRRHFRMLERVYVGDPDQVDDWATSAGCQAASLFEELGISVRQESASDPFFGPRARLLAASQLNQELKTEFVFQVDGAKVALASLNRHRDHLTSAFRAEGGSEPHRATSLNSACLAFGLERVAVALWCAGGRQEDELLARLRSKLSVARASPHRVRHRSTSASG